jgi:hypothetical protein
MAITVGEITSAANAQAAVAQGMVGQAQSALDSAISAAQSIVLLGAPTPVTTPTDMKPIDIPKLPNLTNVAIPALGTQPQKPSVQQITPQFNTVVPALTAVMPQTNIPALPAALTALQATMPQVTMPTGIPSAPNAFAGTVPTLSSVSLPSAPSISQPGFAGQRPTDITLSTDPDTFAEAFDRVSHSMMADINNQVSTYLNEISPDHGRMYNDLVAKLHEFASGQTETGFSPAVENAIYERSKSKTNAETTRVQQDALLTAARRGFTLPSGALMSAMQQARQAGADNNATAAREIVVQQAELQQKNMQFALSAINELHKTTITASLSYQQNVIQLAGMAIQYASQLIDALIKMDQMLVQVYNAKLEGYKADASVFETLIQAGMRQVELYKARIQGEMAKVEVDKARVDAYKSQVEAHKAAVDAYGSNVQAIVALANLEKIKVDVFQAQVQAFSAEAQAKAVEFQGYAAAWNGEEAKTRAYAAQVQAYSTQVEAFRTTIAAEGERIRALGISNQSELGAYEAEVRAWGTQAQANATVVSAQLDQQKTMINAYDAGSRAVIAQASAEAERFRALSTVAIENAKMQNTLITEQGRISVENIKMAASTAASVGDTYGRMAGAAVSGATTLLGAIA